MQQLGCFAVVEVVEASPQRLAIQRDSAARWIGRDIPADRGMAAEHLLDRLWIEALQDIANGSMRWRTLASAGRRRRSAGGDAP